MAVIKAILANVTIENAVTVWTRHDPPIALAHLRLSGPTGRQLYKHLGGGPPDTWVPGLHSIDELPALAKKVDGKLAHEYAGGSRNPPLVTDEGGALTLEERRALLESRGVWDVWLRGRGYAHVNGTARDKTAFTAIAADAQLLSLLAPAVVWNNAQQTWAECPARYKNADGSPRVDPDNATRWTQVSAAEPEGGEPL